MPNSKRDRTTRQYDDADIRAIVRKQAATPAGASKVLLKDRFYAYSDRARVGELIEDMVRAGELYSAYFPGGNGRGRGSTRAFVNRAHAVAFAAGQGPVAARTVAVKRREPLPIAGLHDKLDAMGAPRGIPMTGLRKPGSNARPIPVQQPAPTEARITDKTRVTVAPACHDQRFTVRELPPGYVSALDPREARPWAQAAAGGRA